MTNIAVEIDSAKLDAESFKTIGGIQALSRWSDMLASYAKSSDNYRERETLAAISKALFDDADQMKIVLLTTAQRLGACQLAAPDLPKH